MAAGVVAREFGVSVRSVERLYHDFVEHGKEATTPKYDRCGSNPAHRAPPELLAEACRLRKKHPRWGAPLIRVMMGDASPGRELPCSRTLQRCFAQHNSPPAPRGRRPAADDRRATRPHEVWQMDAKDQFALKNGRMISWLRILDEYSSAVLDSKVYPQAHFPAVGPWEVQAHLRRVFLQWGRPECFRVDNGVPWGSPHGDLPSDLALWLIGLGIEMIWIPPRQPQYNGVVERFQGVGEAWGEPGTCRSVRELQRRLDKLDRIQRELYPYQGDQSRCAVFPELTHSSRDYSEAWEKKHWSHELVLAHMEQYLVPRTVDHSGVVSIYNWDHRVGRQHAGEAVSVMLDPGKCEWVVLDDEGRQLRAFAAEELTRERITRLDVAYRRPKPK